MQLQPRYNESGYTRLFKFYGVELGKNGNQLSGECPFLQCRDDSHTTPVNFFANPASGLWDCKKCGRSGNSYNFIRCLYEDAYSQTTDEDFERLSSERNGVSASTLKHFGVAYNYINDEWLIPAYSLQREKLINLYAWKQEATRSGPIMTVMSGPTFKLVLFGLPEFRRQKVRPVWLTEGPWDFMSQWELFQSDPKFAASYDILGVPGTTIPDEDLPLLLGRELVFLGDNDTAGQSLITKAAHKMSKVSIFPSKMSYLDFDSIPEASYKHRITKDKPSFPPGSLNPPTGYDVRDLKNDLGSDNALTYMLKHQIEYKIDMKAVASTNYDQKARSIPCEQFQELVESTSKELFLPECLYDTLAVMCAIAATVQLKSHPLWAYVVGPPSSGKTTLLSLVSAAQDHCFGMTTWTGLVSGFTQHGRGDASILPKLNGKCVTIEDLTPILNEPKPTQDRLFGELRDVYEGKTSKYYRNFESRNFSDQKFHILACVTDRIRSINNTDLGERFLHVEQDTYWTTNGTMVRDGVDRKKLMASASSSVLEEIGYGNDIPKLIEQRSMCWGLLDHIINRIKDDKMWVQSKTVSFASSDMVSYIEELSAWVSYARTVVQRDRDKQLLFRPRAEYGTRIMKQLTKLAIALSLLFDESFPSEKIKGIIRKVALDSGSSFQQEIMHHISHSDRGLGVNDLSHLLNISATHVLNRVRDMQELGIVYPTQPVMRGRGNQPHIYTFTKDLASVSKSLGFTKQSGPIVRKIGV